MDEEIVKALDRLSATIIMAAIISRQDMKVESIDNEMLKKALDDNFYLTRDRKDTDGK